MPYGLCFMPAARCPPAPYSRYMMRYIMLYYGIYCPYAHFMAAVANILLAFHLHFTGALHRLVNRQFAAAFFLLLFFFATYFTIMLIYLLCLIYVNRLLAPCNKMHSLVVIIMISRQSNAKTQAAASKKANRISFCRADKSNQDRQRAFAATD